MSDFADYFRGQHADYALKVAAWTVFTECQDRWRVTHRLFLLTDGRTGRETFSIGGTMKCFESEGPRPR